jgi:predicted membrane-bound mannosyltransferase
VAAGLLVAILVAMLFLSSFFTNLRGPVDGVLTYLPWLNRAGGDSPHINPWSFYLQRLVWWRVGNGPVWSEGFIVALAAVGLVGAWHAAPRPQGQPPTDFVRWVACYTLALTAIYSLIPYKTPWCLLQFLVGLILLAGVGASVLMRLARNASVRAIIAALLVAGGGHLAWQAYQASVVLPADVGNPYAFAQTSPDVRRLSDTLQQLAETSPQRWTTPVKVIWNDAYYWPLPWYLRRFEHVELWREFPAEPAAPVVISSPTFDKQLTARLGDDYLMTDYYELRPRVFAQLWVRFDLWEAYLRRLGRID